MDSGDVMTCKVCGKPQSWVFTIHGVELLCSNFDCKSNEDVLPAIQKFYEKVNGGDVCDE